MAGSVEWIAKTREEPVDPTRRIVDAHHHLVTDGAHLGAEGQYLVDELLTDTRAGHDVTRTVYIECGSGYREDGPEELRPVGESEFAAEQARKSDGRATRIAAIVAYADLTLGDGVDDVLQAHEAAGDGRFRGIRHRAAVDPGLSASPNAPPPDLLAQDGFRRGLTRLGASGYSFDAWVFHPQLPLLAETARAVAGTPIVVDHLGAPLGAGPYQDREAVRAVWQRGLRELASCPNVVVKLGGVGMGSLLGTDWSTRDRPPTSDEVVERFGDHFRFCIDTFGPDRCMFESNYPVDRGSVGYTVLWNAFQKVAVSYTDSEQDALFANTAARVYRIPL